MVFLRGKVFVFFYLQCTTMGPAYCGLQVFTFLRNFSIPMGVKGTPKSGQLVKWNWVTSLWGFFPDTSPTFRERKERTDVSFTCWAQNRGRSHPAWDLENGFINAFKTMWPCITTMFITVLKKKHSSSSLGWVLSASVWCLLGSGQWRPSAGASRTRGEGCGLKVVWF